MSCLHRPARRLALVVLATALSASTALVAAPAAVAAPASRNEPQAAPWPHDVPDRGRARAGGRCFHGPRGLPSSGCSPYLGAAHGGNTDPSRLEADLGRRLGVHRLYYTSTQVGRAVTDARADARLGRLPWISFKLPHSWERMATGAGDAWARDLALRLADVPGPVWVAFHHEPEGDGDIAAWRRLQERLGPLVRRSAPNVAFTVVLTGWNQLYGAAPYRLDAIWPDTKVDVAGFDVYQKFGVVKDGRLTTKWTDMEGSYFAPLSAWAERTGTRFALAETGLTDEASAADPAWIERTHRELARNGGVAMTYFDTTLNSVANWALSTPSKRADFADTLAGASVFTRRRR